MYLEVLQARKALVAGGTVVRLLIGVSPDVDQHLVPGGKHTHTHTQCVLGGISHTTSR